jgi:5-methyltetrahydrofolate--homocysteine methyltransferase
LPARDAINAAFISLAIYYGLTCPIANPEKITAAIRATDLVMGRDDFAMRFIEHYQSLNS